MIRVNQHRKYRGQTEDRGERDIIKEIEEIKQRKRHIRGDTEKRQRGYVKWENKGGDVSRRENRESDKGDEMGRHRGRQVEETYNGKPEGAIRRGDIEREREKETEVQNTIGVR